MAEVVGPTCSGKTQLFLATACRASERGRNVAWVDAGSSSFSPARARAMKGRLDLIRVCFAEDAWAMLRSLDDAGRFLKPGDVCVVDAPSRVLTPNLGGDRNPQGHQLLALATRALQTLARQGVCVLVANSTARGLSDGMDDEGSLFDESWKAALGPVWSTCASLRLALAAPRNGVFRCALAKAPDSCLVRRRFGFVRRGWSTRWLKVAQCELVLDRVLSSTGVLGRLGSRGCSRGQDLVGWRRHARVRSSSWHLEQELHVGRPANAATAMRFPHLVNGSSAQSSERRSPSTSGRGRPHPTGSRNVVPCAVLHSTMAVSPRHAVPCPSPGCVFEVRRAIAIYC